MPRVTGSLGNCYRLSINDAVIGYFQEESVAELVSLFIQEQMDEDGENINVVIEKWFIEGEF